MTESSLVGFVAQFAATGHIGALRIGIDVATMGAALRSLGIGHQNVESTNSTDKHGSLDLGVSDGRLVLLGLDHDGDLNFELPGSLGIGTQPTSVPRDLLEAELTNIGCPLSDDPSLTFPGHQSALRTGAGVSLVFSRPSALDVDMATDAECLAAAYISAACGATPYQTP